jgi:aerobic C4-dicarboxylate transport protein
MKPLGDTFIKLIKMLIAPIIFCTVVHGIASMEDMKKVGRVGLKALVYFEVMTTIALIIGLVVVNLWQPGVGMNIDPNALDTKGIATYTQKAAEQSTLDFFLHIIPATVVGAFAEGEILQVLFFAVLFAFALQYLGERGKPLLHIIDQTAHVFFGIVGIIMKLAPIGAFGAMAFTIGKYGVSSLLSLASLMAGFYATCLLFVLGVLGVVCWLCGFSIFKFIRYIKEELLIVLGTSSSESVLPRMLAKMENLGADKSVVGLVIPTGYSFNLDGTCIYLTMAGDVPGPGHQHRDDLRPAARADRHPAPDLEGGGRRHRLGLHRARGDAGLGRHGAGRQHRADPGRRPVHVRGRALTNLVGNGVATVVVAKWEGALDEARMHAHLNNETVAEADDPEAVLVEEDIQQAAGGLGGPRRAPA